MNRGTTVICCTTALARQNTPTRMMFRVVKKREKKRRKKRKINTRTSKVGQKSASVSIRLDRSKSFREVLLRASATPFLDSL